MIDLYNKQYDLQILKEHIYAVSLWDILKTQRLTSNFCVKYILNKNYQMEKNDETITINDVVNLQPHISKIELLVAIANYSPDDDSYEDFESFANRHN
jgi:hypothetical protein